ncbi:hypothetical protein DNP65_23780, partial [Salmonella enterica subsp. enterica serovar Panama]|uniref:hypothetical protein n=1 Tax=Salmonella enterica TaxID=28901 RepID=UPI00117B3DD3
GEGYFEVEMTFENMKLEDKHIQEPAGCFDAVQTPNSFCRFDRFVNMDVGTKRLPESVLKMATPLYKGDTGYSVSYTHLRAHE